ncbi:conserved hypothetical protein [Frankia canadensis]|uniref:NmrA-like domain-containing protein n=1 Tax=Frankia canadensis TaxID=1836972 RepID=A0A2I2KV13_9ACTN|nr:NmrA family NAD(P)-binding protein [Frankia canadensis]SNQ49509.1 conserved hypothetical protein [Frankia canadensis]SOU56799.1 conserved hypothetical protein [Frankia canadensis]
MIERGSAVTVRTDLRDVASRGSRVNLTVIRPVFFMDNLINWSPVSGDDRQRVFRYPLLPGVPLQMIAVEDIGEICATAVMDAGKIPHGSLEIGGDELTAEEIAEALQAESGVPTRFEADRIDEIEDDDQRAMYEWFGKPPSYAADFGTTARLRPSVMRLPEFLARQR